MRTFWWLKWEALAAPLLVAVACAALFCPAACGSTLWAQETAPADDSQELEADEAADDADERSAPASTGHPQQPQGLNLFWLLQRGGWFMAPIYLMSILVVTFAIERGIGLRRVKVLPRELIDSLGALGSAPGGFDPRKAYRLCQQFPSAASTVIRAMLLKVGRPHSEVEHAVAEAGEREAARLYANVRWLTLAAAVAPLLGLLGTVWGMIRAFYDTTNLAAGQNKADFLAQGIYEALVTTLGGLVVAIPAAILAHYFEGRIQALFHQVDELLFSLLPQIERYEGRLRVSRQSLGAADGTNDTPKSSADQQASQPPSRPTATPTPTQK